MREMANKVLRNSFPGENDDNDPESSIGIVDRMEADDDDTENEENLYARAVDDVDDAPLNNVPPVVRRPGGIRGGRGSGRGRGGRSGSNRGRGGRGRGSQSGRSGGRGRDDASAALPRQRSNAARRTVQSRGPAFRREEIEVMLNFIEEVLPIGPDEWDEVVNFHLERFPGAERNALSLRQKFTQLYKTRIPTGDPSCPNEVRRAKQIFGWIQGRADAASEVVDSELGFDEESGADDDMRVAEAAAPVAVPGASPIPPTLGAEPNAEQGNFQQRQPRPMTQVRSRSVQSNSQSNMEQVIQLVGTQMLERFSRSQDDANVSMRSMNQQVSMMMNMMMMNMMGQMMGMAPMMGQSSMGQPTMMGQASAMPQAQATAMMPQRFVTTPLATMRHSGETLQQPQANANMEEQSDEEQYQQMSDEHQRQTLIATTAVASLRHNNSDDDADADANSVTLMGRRINAHVQAARAGRKTTGEDETDA